MFNDVITFLGCGSWGAALGNVLENKGLNVKFWHRNSKTVKDMQLTRKHYLIPNVKFGKGVFHKCQCVEKKKLRSFNFGTRQFPHNGRKVISL